MTPVIAIWLALLTVAALYFFIRGNHHRNVININARQLGRVGDTVNRNVELTNANFREAASKLHELKINGIAAMAVSNANADMANENFRSAKLAFASLKQKVDSLKSSTSDRIRTLSNRTVELMTMMAELSEIIDVRITTDKKDANHGIDAVDARVTLVNDSAVARLGGLEDALTMLVEALRNPDATDGGPVADAIEAVLQSRTAPKEALPLEIRTKHGPAWLADPRGGFRPDVYTRPAPDGQSGNLYFDRDGKEIDCADAYGTSPLGRSVERIAADLYNKAFDEPLEAKRDTRASVFGAGDNQVVQN